MSVKPASDTVENRDEKTVFDPAVDHELFLDRRSYIGAERTLLLKTAAAQVISRQVIRRLTGLYLNLDVTYGKEEATQALAEDTRSQVDRRLKLLVDSLQAACDAIRREKPERAAKMTLTYNEARKVRLKFPTLSVACVADILLCYDRLAEHWERKWFLQRLPKFQLDREVNRWALEITETLADCENLVDELKNQVAELDADASVQDEEQPPEAPEEDATDTEHDDA